MDSFKLWRTGSPPVSVRITRSIVAYSLFKNGRDIGIAESSYAELKSYRKKHVRSCHFDERSRACIVPFFKYLFGIEWVNKKRYRLHFNEHAWTKRRERKILSKNNYQLFKNDGFASVGLKQGWSHTWMLYRDSPYRKATYPSHSRTEALWFGSGSYSDGSTSSNWI